MGKTFLGTLLARHLTRRGLRVAALKPLASGGREDARALRDASGRWLDLGEVNPWWFRAALAPAIAAEREGRRIEREAVVKHVLRVGARADVVLVEGAGGLLSPLGAGFDSRDLILALAARPIVVASNRLGVLNEVLLTLEALPARPRRQAWVVLMATSRRPRDLVQRTSAAFLRAKLGGERVVELPRWPGSEAKGGPILPGRWASQLGPIVAAAAG